jgi:holo-[acyl-carrier protein] synthase
MKIYGIGTDIVKSARIAQLWQQHGDAFLARILTEYEAKAFAALKNNQIAFLSKRFAAKEAVAKALGTGFRDQVLLTQLGIETDPSGKPNVVFYGQTQDYISSIGNLTVQISISDEAEYVVAFVIITQD